jgi:hypothetical protein
MGLEDWRVRVVVTDTGGVGPWSAYRLEARALADDVGAALGDRVAVSRDNGELFLYVDGAEAARAAAEVVKSDLREHDWSATVAVERWHDDAEEWKPGDAPLPSSEAERAAEHEELVASEDAASSADAAAGWEVRVDLPSHRDARALAERIEREEGFAPVKRWKYLFVGAPDEDAARVWATRLGGWAPPGSKITVEATFRSVERNNPFAIFGAGDVN